MNTRNTTMGLLSLGLLIGLCPPAWSADSGKVVANAKSVSIDPPGKSLLAIPKPVLADPAIGLRVITDQCKPQQIYSQHDVVGDPKTCAMSRYNFGTAP
jgi:hypothetical protein